MIRRDDTRLDHAHPTGRAQQQREHAAAIDRARRNAAEARRVRLDDVAAMYDAEAQQLASSGYAWPDGMTRERAVLLIARVRPEINLDDATDAYVGGMLAAFIANGQIRIDPFEALSRKHAEAAAAKDAVRVQKLNEQVAAIADAAIANRVDAEPDPFDPQENGVGSWASPHAAPTVTDPLVEGAGQFASSHGKKRSKKR